MFWRKRQVLPDFTPEMGVAVIETVACCQAQVCDYLDDEGGDDLPYSSQFQDECIAAYVRGFLNGYLQGTGILRLWSNGDPAVEDSGYLSLCAVVVPEVLGHDRASRVEPALSTDSPPEMHFMDRVGGTDGIAHIEERDKQYGGGLLHFLRNNP